MSEPLLMVSTASQWLGPARMARALARADCEVSLLAPADSLAAKSRYRQADASCRLGAGRDGAFRLEFDEPQWAVTPGQSAVLYDGEVCLGGGVIATAA